MFAQPNVDEHEHFLPGVYKLLETLVLYFQIMHAISFDLLPTSPHLPLPIATPTSLLQVQTLEMWCRFDKRFALGLLQTNAKRRHR